MGVYCGVIALVNPALLLSAFSAIVVWVWFRVRRTAGWMPSGGGADVRGGVLAVADPQCARLSCVHSRCARRWATNSGWAIDREATGYLDESLFPTYNRQELQEYMQRGELGYTAWKEELAHEYILRRTSGSLRA